MDTVIYGLSNVLKNAPHAVSAQVMLVVQTLINFFIPSATGQASATMPIMAQLADIIGVSRQTAKFLHSSLAMDFPIFFWPTADIVIICALGGTSARNGISGLPLFLILFVTQAILLGIATGIGF